MVDPRPRAAPSYGNFAHVSASQLKSHRECARKWFYQKVLRVSVPETLAMGLGKVVHSELESWVKTGAELVHPLARLAPEHLPERSALVAETPLEAPTMTLEGIPFLGYVDALAERTDTANALVVDYKTTSDFRWMKTPAELAADPQPIAYARWAMMRADGYRLPLGSADPEPAPDARPVDVRFIYLRTRGAPAVRRSEVTLAPADLDAPWAEFAERVRSMKSLAVADITPREVPGTYTSCDAYGGCPHKRECDKIGRPSGLSALFSGQRAIGASLSEAFDTALGAVPALLPASSLTRKEPVSMAKAPSTPNVTTLPKSLSAAMGASGSIEGFTLYVDSFPRRGSDILALDLAPVLAGIAARVASEFGAPDILAVEFGKWKGPFRAEVIAWARTDAKGASFYLRSAGDLSAVALEALAPFAETIVTGTR